MRLAVVTAQIGTASETFIRQHIEGLAPGRTVVIARHAGGGDFWTVSAPLFCVDTWAGRLPVRVAQRLGVSGERMRDGAVSRFLRRHDVDVVLGEYLHQFVDFVPVLDRLGIRYVAQGLGMDVSASLRAPRMAERYRAYESAAAVLTRSEFHRRRLIALGLPAGKVHVNPGGVDVPPAAVVRGPASSKRFLAVGRMVAKKGPIYLLEAFRLAAREDPALSLDVIGDGPLLAAARQFVRASGLESRVNLHGAAAYEVVERHFKECGAFIQHSLTDPDTGDEEGLPTAILQAMAHAMPVISTRHAGIPEAVEHDVTGWLCEEGDAEGMARALLLVAADPARAQAAGLAGYARAQARYTWDGERARLLGHLLNGHSGRP